LLLLAAFVVPAFAWDENINVSRNCEGVNVTASPENEYTDHSGQNQERWHPISTEGTGFFPWNGNPHLEGNVRVRYQLQRSTDWGSHWFNVTPAQYSYGDGWIHWSKDRSGQCPPFEIPGCTDPRAENYDPNANVDDGSCIYYQVCTETVVTEGEWSDWLEIPDEPNLMYRFRVISVLDARDGSDCGTHEEYQGAGLFCVPGEGEVWFNFATDVIPENANFGPCPYVPYFPCERVAYGDTLEGISISMFGGPSYYYQGFLVVCTSAHGDWGEGCVPALGFAPEDFVPGLFVCPAPSPGTGE
jgi:hypothetical protein